MRSLRLLAVVTAVEVGLSFLAASAVYAEPPATSAHPASSPLARIAQAASTAPAQPTMTVTADIVPLPAPDPASLLAGSFTFNVSGEPDSSQITKMSLNFGDGTVGGTDWQTGDISHQYSKAGFYQAKLTVTYAGGQTTTVTKTVIAGDSFFPRNPVRVGDSRSGTGRGTIPAHSVVTAPAELLLGARDWAPADTALLNVTATDTAAAGYVTVYADGTPRPTASSLDFAAHQTVANQVTANIGADGFVAFYNGSSKPIDLIIDASGFNTSPGWTTYFPAAPERLLDTRTSGHPVPGRGTLDVPVTGRDGVPSNATAALLNLTATDTRGSGFLTAFDTGLPHPAVSDLNWTPGQVVQNLVMVPLKNGTVELSNSSSGSVDFLADLVGYYASGTGSVFMPTTPTRLLDTRNGTGAPAGQLAPGHTLRLHVPGPAGTRAATLNLTVTGSSAHGYLTAYADGTPRPGTSSINWAPGQTVANMTVTQTSADGYIDLYNGGSKPVSVIADLSGYYFQYPNETN